MSTSGSDAGPGTPERFPIAGADCMIAHGQECWAADFEALRVLRIAPTTAYAPDPGFVNDTALVDGDRLFASGCVYGTWEAAKDAVRRRAEASREYNSERLAWVEQRLRELDG